MTGASALCPFFSSQDEIPADALSSCVRIDKPRHRRNARERRVGAFVFQEGDVACDSSIPLGEQDRPAGDDLEDENIVADWIVGFGYLPPMLLPEENDLRGVEDGRLAPDQRIAPAAARPFGLGLAA